MAVAHTAKIESLADASRYLGELGSQHGFGEAVQRVRAHSDTGIAEQLGALERYVRGETAERPGPELLLIGEVVRNAPNDGDAGKAIGAAASAMAGARSLAAQVRVGLPGDVFYIITLLLVASVVVLVWFLFISPQYSDIFSQFGASLPALSGVAVSQPWIMFIPLLVIAAAVVWAIATSFRVAAAIAVIAPLGNGLPLGRRLRRTHERWRQLTVARALAAAGKSPEESLGCAAEIGGSGAMPDPDLAAKLALAVRLGVADAELSYLNELELNSLQRELDTWRAALLRILQVVIAVFIGAMVIAMYLPIFKLGAVV